MSPALSGRRPIDMIFAIRSKYPMESCQLHSRPWDQGSQFGDEIQRIEDGVRGPIAAGRFELASDI